MTKVIDRATRPGYGNMRVGWRQLNIANFFECIIPRNATLKTERTLTRRLQISVLAQRIWFPPLSLVEDCRILHVIATSQNKIIFFNMYYINDK